MPQILDFRSLTRAAPIVALALGAIAALLMAVLPEWRLEALVASTGLADILSAARPPLGATARSALALVTGAAIAGAAYAAMILASRLLSASADRAGESDVPVLRRADAHPDAPARRPLRASEELGQPLPIAPAAEPAVVADRVRELASVRTLPADLETPLAAVDPGAIPSVPRQPVRPVAPLARPAPIEADLGETFALTPIRRLAAPKAQPLPTHERLARSEPTLKTKPAPVSAPAQPASLGALLDRLERGAARIDGRPTPSVEEALGLLRGLATR